MTLSLYDISVPVFIRAFNNLSKNLAKARAHADANGIAHDDLLGARLFPDMHPLTAQVQRASDAAKFVPGRVADIKPPAMEDNEKSFDELEARIRATVDFLKSVPANAFDGREDAEVVLKFGGQPYPFTARDYLLGFAIPNFYFHVTTAYAIMRHKGVPLGKMDFIGGR
ncbi:MAG: DUF1993 family protein [Rhizobiaceae bacterium]